MNLEMLKKSDRIFFECVAGSWLYNTNIPTSDRDTRGFYINPPEDYLGLNEPTGQVGDEKNDTTYYSLKRAFELLIKANPNMLELLWVPKSCVTVQKPLMDKIIEHRDLFISKKCFHTFSGYSFAQIQKARGQNKRVNHPELAIKPKKEDFCWVIPPFSLDVGFLQGKMNDLKSPLMPCRPMPLTSCVSDSGEKFDLSLFHCSALEHVPNTYRLYLYGKGAKGVFRGEDMLVCESIPFEDEITKFAAILIYNKHDYEKALSEHKKYSDWIENRNDARWVDQEKGLLNYDQKNMLHCVRLLMSGENILRHGFPLVRFEGEQREYLMKIRHGEFEYDALMAEVEKRMAGLEELYKTSTLPHSVDTNKIDALYRELSGAVFL